MIHIPNEGYDEPAMRFEGLVRYAFDCGRFGDPEQRADAGIFDAHFVPDISEEAVEILHYLLDQLIIKHPEKSEDFIALRESVDNNLEQQSSIALIDYITSIIKN